MIGASGHVDIHLDLYRTQVCLRRPTLEAAHDHALDIVLMALLVMHLLLILLCKLTLA